MTQALFFLDAYDRSGRPSRGGDEDAGEEPGDVLPEEPGDELSGEPAAGA